MNSMQCRFCGRPDLTASSIWYFVRYRGFLCTVLSTVNFLADRTRVRIVLFFLEVYLWRTKIQYHLRFPGGQQDGSLIWNDMTMSSINQSYRMTNNEFCSKAWLQSVTLEIHKQTQYISFKRPLLPSDIHLLL
jgi:hypothetical protein